jgi:hypothetical protein
MCSRVGDYHQILKFGHRGSVQYDLIISRGALKIQIIMHAKHGQELDFYST